MFGLVVDVLETEVCNNVVNSIACVGRLTKLAASSLGFNCSGKQ